MKWSTAVSRVSSLGQECERMASLPSATVPIRVTQLWAAGDMLGRPREVDAVTVVLVVDLPAELVPWWCDPVGARWWADTTRMSKLPALAWWRSGQVPVWNHRIVRPLLVWDATAGVRGEAMTAMSEGNGAAAGLPEPSRQEYVARMNAELEVSLAELQRRTHAYEGERTARLGVRADALFAAAQGYLDVLAAGTGLAHAEAEADGS